MTFLVSRAIFMAELMFAELIFLYPAILSNRASPARICIQYAPAVCFGILAGNGGDILIPADRGPLFILAAHVRSTQHGASIL